MAVLFCINKYVTERKNMFICTYCSKECFSKNSFINHERCCPKNINRNYINGMTGKVSHKKGKTKEKTAVGNALATIFSQENISKAVGYGMQYASTRLNANAQKGTNQQAIDFEKAQTEKALAQARILEAQGKLPQVSPTGSEKKKWVMPVAIGGGVLLLGVIIYFVAKKK
jgi:hypothetical protein